MPRWPDIATWVGTTPNTSGSIADHMYVVIHTADGSYDGTIAWQKNPSAKVSSHFIVAKDGRCAQMLDTNARSWCQIEGNPYSIAIENEGNENTPLTSQQIEAIAHILAKANQVHGVPLQITGRVGTRGLGHHSMGAESGVNWGHSACPGSIIKSQKPQILARAQQIISGNPAAVLEAFMAALTDDQQKDIWVWLANMVDPSTPDAGRADDRFHFPSVLNKLKSDIAVAKSQSASNGSGLTQVLNALSVVASDVASIKAAGVSMTDAQVNAQATAIANALIASNSNGLTDADHAAVVADVKQALREGSGTSAT
jgi:hypothetical protein